MAEINWLEVRAGYEAGVPVRKLAAEYGIGSAGTISKRADREGWAKPLRPGDVTGTGETQSVDARKRKQRKRKQSVSAKQKRLIDRALGLAENAAEAADDEPDSESDGLTERERRFVLHYACTGQPQLAARRAGYAWNTAKYRARDALKKPAVIAAIEEMRAERAARLGITADRVVQELARVGLVNITDLATFGPGGVVLNLSDDISPDDAAAIVEVSETKDGGVKVKLAPKLQALKLLAEHTGVIGKRDSNANAVVINVVERGKRG